MRGSSFFLMVLVVFYCMCAGFVVFRDGFGGFQCPCAGFVGFRDGFWVLKK